ncbi:MAG: PD40 domain-containing protein [Nitrospiraceae bacterium]|nr:MAG: PD40 domain-containing protein [Nitrospiraceae bacterium]
MIRIFLFIILILGSGVWIPPSAEAKVYLDITSPAVRKLPLMIRTPGTPASREIESIVKSDLGFTGLFTFVDPGVPGAEIIADIGVEVSDGFRVTLSLQDLIMNREVLRRRLISSVVRPLAHSISDAIYMTVTGKEGMFRTKITYLVNTAPGRKELQMMDWDGARSRTVTAKGLTSSHCWSQDGKYLLYASGRKRKWKIYIFDLKDFREMTLFTAEGLNMVGGTSRSELVALSSSRDGDSEIFTMDLYGKGFRKITRSFAIDVSPVFSPDGSRIAFVSDRGGTPQIYTMNLQGGDLRRLTFEGSYNTSPSWSPDGKWIAYSGRTHGKNQIFMVQSDGSEIKQLTGSGNNENPSFSPDGFFVAFDSDRDGRRGIYIVSLRDGGEKRITPKKMRASSPEWSPYLK